MMFSLAVCAYINYKNKETTQQIFFLTKSFSKDP